MPPITFDINHPTASVFWGNVSLVACCVFYLLWWVLAFKPTGAIKGFKSGWLLIPAVLLGIASVILIIKGSNAASGPSFFSAGAVLLVAIVVYLALLLVTQLVFHRQVTTELVLIVGWTALVFLEGNALFGMGVVARSEALVLFAVAVAVAVVSMVCYLLYFGLADLAGYLDGMIPLVLVAVYMVVLSVLMTQGGGS